MNTQTQTVATVSRKLAPPVWVDPETRATIPAPKMTSLELVRGIK